MRAGAGQQKLKWAATRIFYENAKATKPVVLNIGGARSSKSYSIIQLFISKFFGEKNKTFLTTRKTFPALRITAYKQAEDLLEEHGLYGFLEHNRSDHTFRNPWGNNYWLFSSIDNPEKIKSTEFNYIHMEEGNEFTYDDYRILKLRLSAPAGKGEANHIYISLNPSDERGWVRQALMGREEHDLIHSTYRDNPFLQSQYVQELESLKDLDPSYWAIYGMGEFAAVRELIYGPLDIIRQIPTGGETIYGLDFGYNNPTVLLEITIHEPDIYLRELIHERMLTTPDLIKRMNDGIPRYFRKRPIYADPSEPDRIEEINRAGFMVYPANNEVRGGIIFLRRFHLHSLPENTITNREFSSYKWRQDRNGQIMDEPLKYEDHSPDALRYAAYTHLAERTGTAGYYLGFSKEDAY